MGVKNIEHYDIQKGPIFMKKFLVLMVSLVLILVEPQITGLSSLQNINTVKSSNEVKLLNTFVKTKNISVKEECTTEAINNENKNEAPTVTNNEDAESEKVINTYFDVPLDEDLQDYIFLLCRDHNIKPELVISMIKKESNFNSSSIGDNGNSYGLMQIQPRWNQSRMESLGCTDLLDPYQNITVGIDLLSELFDTGKSVEWVLMAYNGGTSYANRKEKSGEISNYAYTVLNNSEKITYKM